MHCGCSCRVIPSPCCEEWRSGGAQGFAGSRQLRSYIAYPYAHPVSSSGTNQQAWQQQQQCIELPRTAEMRAAASTLVRASLSSRSSLFQRLHSRGSCALRAWRQIARGAAKQKPAFIASRASLESAPVNASISASICAWAALLRIPFWWRSRPPLVAPSASRSRRASKDRHSIDIHV